MNNNINNSDSECKIYFLRVDQINCLDVNLDILPSVVIRELSLVPSNYEIGINVAKTFELTRDRNASVPFNEINHIFTAGSKRCKTTARVIAEYIKRRYLKKVAVANLYLLNEINFRIDKICPEFVNSYKILSPEFIDNQIFKAMFMSDWCESVTQIYWKLEYLFDFLKKFKQEKSILIIGHEYSMRVAELFIRRKKTNGVTIGDLKKTQKNFPMHGFVTDLNCNFFKPLPLLNNDHLKYNQKFAQSKDPKKLFEPQKVSYNIRDVEIYFLRHSKLNLPFDDYHQLPSGIIRGISDSSLDPRIDKWLAMDLLKKRQMTVPLNQINLIFTATSNRCRDTAEVMQKFILDNFYKRVDILEFPYINEVQFNLHKIYPNSVQEFDTLDMNVFRKNLMSNIIKGENCESLRQCYWRIDYFFEMLKKYIDRKKIMVLAHGYILRIIELYIKQRHLTSITEDDLTKTQRNSYLHGFGTDFALSKFIALPPIYDLGSKDELPASRNN